jgi:hypothetical protein
VGLDVTLQAMITPEQVDVLEERGSRALCDRPGLFQTDRWYLEIETTSRGHPGW